MKTVRFGSTTEFVSFTLPPQGALDGLWDIAVEIGVEGFRGAIKAFAGAHDLKLFLEQLRAMHVSLNGSAALRPRDEQFVLELTTDRLGHIFVSGTAWSQATYGNRLDFELAFDQTFLPEPISVLEEALEARGHEV